MGQTAGSAAALCRSARRREDVSALDVIRHISLCGRGCMIKKFVSAWEAVSRIPDNAVVAISGFNAALLRNKR